MATPEDDAPFRSAEEWLAARGVERNPIRVERGSEPSVERGSEPSVERGSEPSVERTSEGPKDTTTPPPAPAPAPPPGAGERQPPGTGADATVPGPEGAPTGEPDHEPERLEDAVARAVSFIRRSTTMQPAAEGRLRDKLQRRGTPARAIDLALEQARRERLVDDHALVHALAEERRSKGHAASRIRMDLRRRGFDDDLIADALAHTEREDPEAVAFGVARARAASYGHLEPEKAFRRLVGHLARRGHAEGLARKVAREVVWADREDERTAGH